MKHLIIDGNNISYIAYHKAKSMKLKQASDSMKSFARLNNLNKDDLEYQEHALKLYDDVEKQIAPFTVYFFLNIFHKLIRDNDDYKVYFIWDGKKGSAWRKEENPDYKATRSHSEDKYYKYYIEAYKLEEELIEHYPIYNMKFDFVEADDIIYSLCHLLEGEKRVVSNDGDMVQLIQKFEDVEVFNPIKKKLVKAPEYDVVLYKSIKGDGSDNISGLRGFGDKKTLKIIEAGLKGLTEEQLQEIEDNKKIIDLAKNPNAETNHEKVQDILNNYVVNLDIDKIKKRYFDLKLKQFLSSWDGLQKMFFQLEKQYSE